MSLQRGRQVWTLWILQGEKTHNIPSSGQNVSFPGPKAQTKAQDSYPNYLIQNTCLKAHAGSHHHQNHIKPICLNVNDRIQAHQPPSDLYKNLHQHLVAWQNVSKSNACFHMNFSYEQIKTKTLFTLSTKISTCTLQTPQNPHVESKQPLVFSSCESPFICDVTC